jgi:pantothenate kinase
LRGVLIISNHKTPAVEQPSHVSLDKPVTWEEVQRDIRSLVGAQLVKEQLLEITRILGNIKEHQARHHLTNMPPIHFLIKGPAGGGKRYVARILSKILQYYQLAEKPLHMVTVSNMESLPEVSAQSPIYVPVVDRLIPKDSRRNYLVTTLFWAHLERIADRQSVILGVDSERGSEFVEALTFAPEIQFKIEIPDYRWEDLLAYARKYAAQYKFKLVKPAVAEFRRALEEAQSKPDFANLRSVEKIIDRAMMNYYIKPGQDAPHGKQYAALQGQHFIVSPHVHAVPVAQKAQNPLAQINSLVGLKEVKARLNQLMALANLQKRRSEQGLSAEPISTHMAFSGSPGSGKTTVARLVGQALKELGVLEKGHLVEAAREDLVGQYVGHTAQKTADVVEQALGGVLFIDECYSLNAGHGMDYGREAVATLIKKMEDARDNLTVIFSGYSQEMEAFLDMNPGLRSRIQFHLTFPDYTGEELMEIFLKLCHDEGYELSREAALELEALLQQLYGKRRDNFANGRLVRSLFERAKLSLATRVWQDPKTASLSLILPQDVQALATYSDVAGLLRAQRRGIGFHAVSA